MPAGFGGVGGAGGRAPARGEGRVPRVLHAHAQIVALCTLRIESTVAHDGEQARADRCLRHSGPTPTPAAPSGFALALAATPKPAGPRVAPLKGLPSKSFPISAAGEAAPSAQAS
jgi:hypothetical protein